MSNKVFLSPFFECAEAMKDVPLKNALWDQMKLDWANSAQAESTLAEIFDDDNLIDGSGSSTYSLATGKYFT